MVVLPVLGQTILHSQLTTNITQGASIITKEGTNVSLTVKLLLVPSYIYIMHDTDTTTMNSKVNRMIEYVYCSTGRY
jgi:putative effector of murein hydrolase LrgA (UPF0299 family)